ncbi:hypothetical protein LEMLEM_LOCUS5023 [Lemmus lemmus]
MLTLAFHYDILKPYVKTMTDSVQLMHVNVTLPMQDKWEQLAAQDSSIMIFQHNSMMTLDTVMKCAFSHKNNVQVDWTSSEELLMTSEADLGPSVSL